MIVCSTCFFIQRTDRGGEEICAQVIIPCLHLGCGGRMSFVVCGLGKVEGGRYFVKNPQAIKDAGILPDKIVCTNCRCEGMFTPEELAHRLSDGVGLFLQGVKQERAQMNAPWN